MAARIHLAGSSDRKGFWFSRAVAIARASSGLSGRIFRSASSWILAAAYTLAASSISHLPHPPTVPGLKTSGSTKGSFFRTLFFLAHYRPDFFLPEPQGQGSLRPIFGSGWRFGILPAPSSAAVFRRSGAKYRHRRPLLNEAHYLVTKIRSSRGSGLPGRHAGFLRTRRQESLKGGAWHHSFERLRNSTTQMVPRVAQRRSALQHQVAERLG
jgi:hypothetical protein